MRCVRQVSYTEVAPEDTHEASSFSKQKISLSRMYLRGKAQISTRQTHKICAQEREGFGVRQMLKIFCTSTQLCQPRQENALQDEK